MIETFSDKKKLIVACTQLVEMLLNIFMKFPNVAYKRVAYFKKNVLVLYWCSYTTLWSS